MAKKKAKRKRRSSSSTPRIRKPFVGDQILAAFQSIGFCCSFSSCIVAASIALGYAFTTDIKQKILASVKDKEIHQFIQNLSPAAGVLFYCLAAVILVFSIIFARGTWQGKKWALWLHLLLNLPGAIITITLGQADSRFGSIIPIIISIYCILRISGSVGPKS